MIIEEREKHLFEDMLNSHDIVANHPRKDEEYKDAVATMKPYWGDWKSTYNWIDSRPPFSSIPDPKDQHVEPRS